MSHSSHEYTRIHQRERLSLVADLLLEGALRVMESANERRLAENSKKTERQFRANSDGNHNPRSHSSTNP